MYLKANITDLILFCDSQKEKPFTISISNWKNNSKLLERKQMHDFQCCQFFKQKTTMWKVWIFWEQKHLIWSIQIFHQCNFKLIKFIYSEKATKCCEIVTLLLTAVHKVKNKGKILQNFVAFSEYINFTRLKNGFS